MKELKMPLPEKTLNEISSQVRNDFEKCSAFLREKVTFFRPESPLHAMDHTDRVLLYALVLCEAIFPGNERARKILSHAAMFHDTRRKDDSHDTGHGARAAIYYRQFCRHTGLEYFPEADAIMRFHDIPDKIGIKGISAKFNERAEEVLPLYRIFKDADALDRWRLGPDGLDINYLRNEEAKKLVNFSRELFEKWGGNPLSEHDA